jgi:nucleotide-binding universal stress UspA family protein
MVQLEIRDQEELFSHAADLRNPETRHEENSRGNDLSSHLNNGARIEERIREIVVPVTGSQNDIKLLRYACELARTLSARIALVCVVYPPEPSFGSSDYAKIENYHDFYSDQLESMGESMLSKLTLRLKKEGIDYRKVITTGDEKKTVNHLIDEQNTETVAIVVRSNARQQMFARLRFLSRHCSRHYFWVESSRIRNTLIIKPSKGSFEDNYSTS